MRFTITKADTWEQINQAAHINTRCIEEGRGNHDKAKQTWEVFQECGDVTYFLIKERLEVIGYVRFLCVAGVGESRTWIADFISPSHYEPVVLATSEMVGAVLVKEFTCGDDVIARSWPKMTLIFPLLSRYPYHQTSITESAWKLVL